MLFEIFFVSVPYFINDNIFVSNWKIDFYCSNIVIHIYEIS